MKQTRVDTKKLKAALSEAAKKVAEAREAVAQFATLLTDAERATTVRAPGGFPEAGRKLAAAMAQHPELLAASDYDAEAVVEDLDNAEALGGLADQLTAFQTLLADSRLTWLAEAYVPSLQLYGMAKVRAKTDALLQQTIAPLAAVFATRRSRKGGDPDNGLDGIAHLAPPPLVDQGRPGGARSSASPKGSRTSPERSPASLKRSRTSKKGGRASPKGSRTSPKGSRTSKKGSRTAENGDLSHWSDKETRPPRSEVEGPLGSRPRGALDSPVGYTKERSSRSKGDLPVALPPRGS